MQMKPIVIVFAALLLILCFVIRDYDQADANLRSFYLQMLSVDFPKARQSIDKAIRLWPANARYYAWRAYCISQNLPSQCPRCLGRRSTGLGAAEQKATREAIADYRLALERNRRDAVVYHNLAWLEHLLGDDATAGKDWREATIIDPNNAVFHLSYGMFLEESGDVQSGREQYETAIQLSPAILDSPFFTRYRSRFPEAADSIVEHCMTRIESRLRLEKDPILEARLGKLYLYLQNLTRSSQLLQDASQKLPNLPLVWFNLGAIYEMQNDTADALNCYKKANVINNLLAGPYLRIGQIHVRTGQKSLAALNLRLAIQRWEHLNPITAGHNNRLYTGPPQKIDDLLPTSLVWYTSPCEASQAYRSLADLSPPNERSRYIQRVNTCEEVPAPHWCPRESR